MMAGLSWDRLQQLLSYRGGVLMKTDDRLFPAFHQIPHRPLHC